MSPSVVRLKFTDPDLFLSLGLKVETVKLLWLKYGNSLLVAHSVKPCALVILPPSYLKNPVGPRMCVWLTLEKA